MYYFLYEFNLTLNLHLFLTESQFYLMAQFFFTNPLIQYIFFFFNFLIFSNFGFLSNFIFFIPLELINMKSLDSVNQSQNLLNGLVLIHPPILFFAYNTLFFLFFFKNSLVSFKNSTWIGFISYNLLKFFFLALILGGWWASNELNWGGWWSWDIVEIGALIALLISILFTHLFKHFFIVANYLYLIHFFYLFFYLSLHWGLLNSVHAFVEIDSMSFSFIHLIYIIPLIFFKINFNKRNFFFIILLMTIFTLFYFIFINFLNIRLFNYRVIFFNIVLFMLLFNFKANFNYLLVFFPFFFNFINFISYFKNKFNHFHIFFTISFISIFFISLGLLQKQGQINQDSISFFVKSTNILFNNYLLTSNYFPFNINSFFFSQSEFIFYSFNNNLYNYYMNISYENQIIKNLNFFNTFYINASNLMLFDPSFILIFLNL